MNRSHALVMFAFVSAACANDTAQPDAELGVVDFAITLDNPLSNGRGTIAFLPKLDQAPVATLSFSWNGGQFSNPRAQIRPGEYWVHGVLEGAQSVSGEALTKVNVVKGTNATVTLKFHLSNAGGVGSVPIGVQIPPTASVASFVCDHDVVTDFDSAINCNVTTVNEQVQLFASGYGFPTLTPINANFTIDYFGAPINQTFTTNVFVVGQTTGHGAILKVVASPGQPGTLQTNWWQDADLIGLANKILVTRDVDSVVFANDVNGDGVFAQVNDILGTWIGQNTVATTRDDYVDPNSDQNPSDLITVRSDTGSGTVVEIGTCPCPDINLSSLVSPMTAGTTWDLDGLANNDGTVTINTATGTSLKASASITSGHYSGTTYVLEITKTYDANKCPVYTVK